MNGISTLDREIHAGKSRTVNNERGRIVHPLNVQAKVERLQTPLLAMRDGLAGRSNEGFGEEHPSEPDFDVREAIELGNSIQLLETLGKVGDPPRHAHALAHFVPAPVVGDGAFGEVVEQDAQVVRLLQFALADLDHVREVLSDLVEELSADGTFTSE